MGITFTVTDAHLMSEGPRRAGVRGTNGIPATQYAALLIVTQMREIRDRVLNAMERSIHRSSKH